MGKRNEYEIYMTGHKALRDALGREDSVTFITMVASGRGDYTKDHDSYNPKTEEEIIAGIKAVRDKMAHGEIDRAGRPLKKKAVA